MLQVFYLDATKVDRDVAHVAMAIHVCFICFFICSLQVFHLDVAYVSHVYCKYFFLDVTYVCNDFSRVFKYFQVFQMHVANVSAVSYVCCKCFI